MRNSCVIKVSICEKEFFLEREGLRSYFFRLFMFHTGSLISFLLCMRWLGQSWNKHGSLSSVFATALSSISGKNTRFPLPHASLWRQSFPSTTAGEWKMRKGMEIGLQHRQWSLLSYSYDRKKKYIYIRRAFSQELFSIGVFCYVAVLTFQHVVSWIDSVLPELAGFSHCWLGNVRQNELVVWPWGVFNLRALRTDRCGLTFLAFGNCPSSL